MKKTVFTILVVCILFVFIPACNRADKDAQQLTLTDSVLTIVKGNLLVNPAGSIEILMSLKNSSDKPATYIIDKRISECYFLLGQHDSALILAGLSAT